MQEENRSTHLRKQVWTGNQIKYGHTAPGPGITPGSVAYRQREGSIPLRYLLPMQQMLQSRKCLILANWLMKNRKEKWILEIGLSLFFGYYLWLLLLSQKDDVTISKMFLSLHTLWTLWKEVTITFRYYSLLLFCFVLKAICFMTVKT